MQQSDRSRLVALGFNSTQVNALAAFWGTRPTEDLFTNVEELQRLGYGPADAYEAVRHNLYPDEFDVWSRHGFSAHQVDLIEIHPHAKANLMSRTHREIGRILDIPGFPRDVLTSILLAADSPTATDEYVTRYLDAANQVQTTGGNPDTLEALTAEVAMMAGLKTKSATSDCCA